MIFTPYASRPTEPEFVMAWTDATDGFDRVMIGERGNSRREVTRWLAAHTGCGQWVRVARSRERTGSCRAVSIWAPGAPTD